MQPASQNPFTKQALLPLIYSGVQDCLTPIIWEGREAKMQNADGDKKSWGNHQVTAMPRDCSTRGSIWRADLWPARSGPGGQAADGGGRIFPHLPGGNRLRWELSLAHHRGLKTMSQPLLPLTSAFLGPHQRSLKTPGRLRTQNTLRGSFICLFFLQLLVF